MVARFPSPVVCWQARVVCHLYIQCCLSKLCFEFQYLAICSPKACRVEGVSTEGPSKFLKKFWSDFPGSTAAVPVHFGPYFLTVQRIGVYKLGIGRLEARRDEQKGNPRKAESFATVVRMLPSPRNSRIPCLLSS